MTVTRTPIVLWLEEAPSDRFDDDSARRYRVVAALGQGATRRHIVPLTREHDTEAAAMAVLSDKILRGCTQTWLSIPGTLESFTELPAAPEMPLVDADGRKWWRR